MRARATLWTLLAAALVAIAVATAGCGNGSKDESASGPVEIEFWHGQTLKVEKLLKELVAEFNRTHPGIKVKTGGVVADRILQKVTAGLQADNYPDVAYVFGSDLPSLARTDKLLDLGGAVKSGTIDWNAFFPAAQQAATVDGRVRAVPALIDNLAVVYNKKIFDDAKVPYPADDWTWADFRQTAAKLNNPDKGIAGFAWPGTGDEDTTWRLWPLVWQQGGDILAKNGKSVGFDGPPGQAALTLINDMARDGSIYIDNSPGSERMQQLFASGKMAMNIAGPWALPEYVDGKIDYGVVQLPAFSTNHTTIAGPDVWAILDNGDRHSKAAIEFVNWLTAPKQQIRWLGESGSLPTRKDLADLPGYAAYEKSLPELNKFIDNLQRARVRPTTSKYPQISQAIGKGIVSVLLGKASPNDALSKAADASNSELKIPGS